MQDASLAGVPSASNAPPHLLDGTGHKAEIAPSACELERLALSLWHLVRLGARARAPPIRLGARVSDLRVHQTCVIT